MRVMILTNGDEYQLSDGGSWTGPNRDLVDAMDSVVQFELATASPSLGDPVVRAFNKLVRLLKPRSITEVSDSAVGEEYIY